MSEKEFLDIFSDNLRDLMNELEIGQNELARALGVKHSTISRYLNKQRLPSLMMFVNICIALECNPDELVPMYEYISLT